MEAITIYVSNNKTGNLIANLILRIISEDYCNISGYYTGSVKELADNSECTAEEIKSALLLLADQDIIETLPLKGASFRITFPEYENWKLQVKNHSFERCA